MNNQLLAFIYATFCLLFSKNVVQVLFGFNGTESTHTQHFICVGIDKIFPLRSSFDDDEKNKFIHFSSFLCKPLSLRFFSSHENNLP
jgi:hypothetical protein